MMRLLNVINVMVNWTLFCEWIFNRQYNDKKYLHWASCRIMANNRASSNTHQTTVTNKHYQTLACRGSTSLHRIFEGKERWLVCTVTYVATYQGSWIE